MHLTLESSPRNYPPEWHYGGTAKTAFSDKKYRLSELKNFALYYLILFQKG